jgi:hypothetical protein
MCVHLRIRPRHRLREPGTAADISSMCVLVMLCSKRAISPIQEGSKAKVRHFVLTQGLGATIRLCPVDRRNLCTVRT